MVIVTVVLSIVLFAALSAFVGGWLAVIEIGVGARVIGVRNCGDGQSHPKRLIDHRPTTERKRLLHQ